jgi:queuine tRNA-ribosyltransferase
MFGFEVLATVPGSGARLGRLVTPHGVVDTPAFMPVGTRGAIKGVTPRQLRETGTQIMLGNTYHLHVRPGAECVAQLGGLHRFSGWDGPILTDSGGFQVFSLAEINQIGDDGVAFQSHFDGAPMFLDPATSMGIQEQLGADIIMAFDQCPPLPSPPEAIRRAVERTVRWAAECRRVHRRADQWLFGIVQGGLDPDLRAECAGRLIEIGFDGYAVGGLSVGETHAEMLQVLDRLTPALPTDRPRYLMGVGMPRDLVEGVARGIDMFDCVLPTRNGRNASVFTATGRLKLRNHQYRLADEPVEAGCDCYTCTHFSRAYLRHLFITGEMLGPTLASIHNLRFFQRLMARIRELIPTGRLERITDEFPVARSDCGGLLEAQG